MSILNAVQQKKCRIIHKRTFDTFLTFISTLLHGGYFNYISLSSVAKSDDTRHVYRKIGMNWYGIIVLLVTLSAVIETVQNYYSASNPFYI